MAADSFNADTRKKKNGKTKQKTKITIFIIEMLIIVAMLIVVWKVFQTTEDTEGPHKVTIDENEIVINSEVKENIGNTDTANTPDYKQEYWNIALFGVDAVKTEQLYKGSRSDSIMIASVNMKTGDIKLVSVYRDTYLNKGNDKYGKCNSAYAANGAPQAMSMLNMNMDLAITDFVTVGYDAVKECVDGLGGVWIDVDSAELEHINNYQLSIIRDTSIPKSEYVPVKDTGYQLLNGLQATAYCRIRYTKGDDYKRAERQREVIKAMEEQAKKTDLSTLTNLLPKVLEHVYTSIDSADMMELLKNLSKYSIVEEGGFPAEGMRTSDTIGADGSCVIPVDLDDNVIWLHEFLFGEEDYTVSSTVKECSEKIKADTAPYLNN